MAGAAPPVRRLEDAVVLAGEERAVYLAETTYDLREKRDAIRRELLTLGLRVLPDQPLPLVREECEQAIREGLAASVLSIHLVGRNYGIVPEGATQSTVVIQNELAIERAAAGDYPRLIWIPEKLECDDERQLKFIEHLQTDTRIQQGADILQTTFEEFKAAMNRRLIKQGREEGGEGGRQRARPSASASGVDGDDNLVRIYLISDRRDETAPAALSDYLYDQGFEVILPVFEGDEAQIRKDHEENLSDVRRGAVLLRRRERALAPAEAARGSEERRVRAEEADRDQGDLRGPAGQSEQGQIPDARGDGHRPARAVRSGRPDQLHQPASSRMRI